jgi:hypothetical protein
MNGFVVFSSLGRLEKLLEYNFNLKYWSKEATPDDPMKKSYV